MTKFFKFREEKIRVPIFETKEKAGACIIYTPFSTEIMRSRSHPTLLPGWIQKYEVTSGGRVTASDYGDIFMIISQEWMAAYKVHSFHIIAGEKAGWILVNENIGLEYLAKDNTV